MDSNMVSRAMVEPLKLNSSSYSQLLLHFPASFVSAFSSPKKHLPLSVKQIDSIPESPLPSSNHRSSHSWTVNDSTSSRLQQAAFNRRSATTLPLAELVKICSTGEAPPSPPLSAASTGRPPPARASAVTQSAMVLASSAREPPSACGFAPVNCEMHSMSLKEKNPKPQSSSGDDNSSSSDSYSNSRERTPSPTFSAFPVKPISSKPLDEPQKPTPRPSAPEPKPGHKRTAKVQNGNDGSSKNKKMKVEDEKKTPYRLWSEYDEVAIMKSVLDLKTKRGADAFADIGAFYEFLKNEFTVAVTKKQLLDKARRLKKKYVTILQCSSS